MGSRSRLWTVIVVCATLLGLWVNSSRFFTRVEQFRLISGSYSVPRGAHVTIYWRVQGVGAHVWLNGEEVVAEDSREFVIQANQEFKLVAKGSLGSDSKALQITLVDGSEAATDPTAGSKISAAGDSTIPASSGADGAEPNGSDAPPPQPGSVTPANDEGLKSNSSTAQSENNTVPAAPASGFLTLRSAPSNASIDISGVGHFDQNFVDKPVRAGIYVVHAAHDLLLPQTQQVTVTPGQHAVLDLRLQPDAARIQKMLADAASQAADGEPQTAIATTRSILAVEPENSQALSIRTLAYFSANDFENFNNSAAETWKMGGSVYAVLAHQDGNSASPVHPVLLAIRPKSLSFQVSSGGRCTLPRANALSPNDVIRVTEDKNGSIFLSLKLGGIAPSSRTTEIRLFEVGTQTQTRPAQHSFFHATENVMVSPGNARQVLESVATVLRNAQ